MIEGPVFSDSSPLIALTQIGRLDLLPALFTTVIIPPAVARETARTVTLPARVRVRPLARAIDPRVVRAGLGPGEGILVEAGQT